MEVVGVGDARVAGQERVGAEQRGGVDVVHQLRDLPIVQRRRIEIDLHPGHQPQQQSAGQAEGVEDRQRVEHDVRRGEIEARGDLRDIGEKVGVGQHDPLRHAFRSGGEQHDGGIVRVGAARTRGRGRERRAPCRGRSRRRADPRARRSGRARSICRTTSSSFAFSTKAREQRTRWIFAVRQAAIRLKAPEVKFSIAATRPAACTAMKATAAALALGSMRPTVSPGVVQRDDLAREQGDAEAKAALRQRPGDRVLEDHAAALALPRAVLEGLEAACADSSSVANTRSDMMS